MRRTGWVAGPAALLVIAAVVGSCGKSAPDPLVGTWRLSPGHGTSSQTPLTIAKQGNGYLATIVYWGPGDTPASPRPVLPFAMKRSGDRLTGTFTKNGTTVRAQIVYEPASRQLTFANSTPDGAMSKPAVFVRVSTSTAYPSTP
jgi:hypothetical protein